MYRCIRTHFSPMTDTATARRLRDALRRVLVAHGALEATERPCGAQVSIPHAHALLELARNPGAMTVSELATRLAIDRTNVSRLCARMEEAGELARSTDPGDARARALRLTARGKKRAAEVDRASVQHFGRLSARLGSSTDFVIDALELLEHTISHRKDEA
jgi:DNA-binding MarR family transcriptional regulator